MCALLASTDWPSRPSEFLAGEAGLGETADVEAGDPEQGLHEVFDRRHNGRAVSDPTGRGDRADPAALIAPPKSRRMPVHAV
jgi:hypothetical protein